MRPWSTHFVEPPTIPEVLIPEVNITRRKTFQSDETAAEENEFDALLERAGHSLRNRTRESASQRKFNAAAEDRALKNVPHTVLRDIASIDDNAASNQIATNIGEQVEYFAESSAVLMKALDEISSIHPFIKVAVMAFKAVIALELKRRENNHKVIALNIQMQDMMSALLPLRLIRDSQHIAPDGSTVENNIKPLMPQIADDIIACGNACDAYTKKSMVAKVLKSFIYEQRLADFGERFVQRRSSLDLALSVHTTMGVTETKHMLSAMNAKLELLLLFRRLDSPREREISQYVRAHGGPNACMGDDRALEDLARIDAGAPAVGVGKRQSRRGSIDLSDVFYLKRELQEDLDESLEKNLDRFLRKLGALKEELLGALENIETSIHREGDRVVTDLTKVYAHGPHERIKDEEIHKLWQDMHWRNAVKAHHFTLALRDHLIEKYRSSQGRNDVHSALVSFTPASAGSTASYVSQSQSPEDIVRAVAEALQRQKRDTDGDRWAFDTLTMLTVQPISEAFDDDGTGFISTREVNVFTSSRPKKWSLLHWLVYWGEGWYDSLITYRHNILRTMQNMYSLLDGLRPANRSAVDQYLGHIAFRRIELLLRGFDISRPRPHQSILDRLRPYTRAEEARLRQRLVGVGYEIDDPSTLEVVKGRGRIEQYIFPLLCLMLHHHMGIIQLGHAYLLDEAELTAASESLYQLMAAVDERVIKLSAIMRQSQVDRHARLSTYSFGMFQHVADPSRCLEDYATDNLLRFNYLSAGTNEEEPADTLEESPKLQKAILSWAYDSSGYVASPALATTESHFSGTWTALCGYHGGMQFGWVSGLLDISLDVDEDGVVSGAGRCALADCAIEGTCETDEDGIATLKFTVIFQAVPWVSSTALNTLSFEGGYLEGTNMLSGSWGNEGDVVPESLILVRTPGDVYRFRHCIDDEGRSSATLWKFARDATLHRVRRQLWSATYFRQRLQEKKLYVDLHSRRVFNWSLLAAQPNLSSDEAVTLHHLNASISPEDARFYFSIVAFRRRQLCIHHNAWCNSCLRIIVNDRYMCLQCTEDGLRYQIDLCASCQDQTPTNGALVHKRSHALARLNFVLHDKSKKLVYDDANEALDRVKQIASRIDGFTLDSPTTDRSRVDSDSLNPPECAACHEPVSLPCCYCSDCHILSEQDVFTCENCRDLSHIPYHVWILVKEESLRPELSVVELRLKALQQRFVNEQKGVSDRMAILERKLDMVLSKLSGS
ncbi:hypothetical protein BD626DRAFT_391201 [Schizophyllum amplum]|uniref:ZZ-type domain-containing protein n=1 Tax=Schizophyllum amplum TaxID=97359 RepID=A0A550D0H4_9AGAR|nr:hypothetical protein BD626DRAFT_391201 [Auriculariopsis ampla]